MSPRDADPRDPHADPSCTTEARDETVEATVSAAHVERGRRGWLTVALLCAAAAAIAGLVLTNFRDSTVYAKGVDQVLADKGRWVGRNVRVEGTMVRGTLRFREKPCQYEFDSTRLGRTVHVRYASCIKPDTLRDDMPDVGVTAEGKLLASGDFEATNVLAKCPSKYDMKKAPQGYPGPQGAPAQGAVGAVPPAVVN